MSYKTEFPEFELGDGIVIPEGFKDESRHNDAMPRFTRQTKNGQTIVLWIDYLKVSMRDYMYGYRFLLAVYEGDDFIDSLCYTDSWDDILTAIDTLEF